MDARPADEQRLLIPVCERDQNSAALTVLHLKGVPNAGRSLLTAEKVAITDFCWICIILHHVKIEDFVMSLFGIHRNLLRTQFKG